MCCDLGSGGADGEQFDGELLGPVFEGEVDDVGHGGLLGHEAPTVRACAQSPSGTDAAAPQTRSCG